MAATKEKKSQIKQPLTEQALLLMSESDYMNDGA
jgi:hypothetical protein